MSVRAARRGRKVECPNCGAEVIVGSGRSGQRVKCPKCTAPIPVDICEPEAQIKSAEAEIAALIEQVARLGARVAALEQQHPQQEHSVSVEQEAQPAAAATRLKWVHPAQSDSLPHGLVVPDAMHEQALVHNLRVLAGSQIIIRSAAGNENARRLAERFKELFAEADWGVNGVADLPVAPGTRGLALAAGMLPPTRETTRTFLAFTAAGFALESRLDMSLQCDETMLIVA